MNMGERGFGFFFSIEVLQSIYNYFVNKQELLMFLEYMFLWEMNTRGEYRMMQVLSSAAPDFRHLEGCLHFSNDSGKEDYERRHGLPIYVLKQLPLTPTILKNILHAYKTRLK